MVVVIMSCLHALMCSSNGVGGWGGGSCGQVNYRRIKRDK